MNAFAHRRKTSGDGLTWKVGKLARQTGLSIRTLHYYEEIGLLAPSGRTGAGHRFYTAADVIRLQQVKSLRQLGLSLGEIRGILARSDLSPRDIIAKQLVRLRRQIKLQQQLCRRLEAILRSLRSAETVSVEKLIGAIEMMTMLEKYYTPEQMEELKQRRNALGEGRIRQVEAEWPQLIAKVRAEMEKGSDPASKEVQRLAKRWMELVSEFTGGSPGIEQSLRSMYRSEPGAAAQYGLDATIFEYVSKAAASKGQD